MQSLATISLFCFVFGALIGSFLSVCTYRLPVGKYEPVHEGTIPQPQTPVSISSPARSFCPHCHKQLLWWHNIPVISWSLLGGKCGFCGVKIPFRYVFLEVFTGCISVMCFLQYGLSTTGVAVFLVLCSMIVIAFIDLDYMIIPNVISYPGTVLGVMIGAANQFLSPAEGPLLGFPFSPTLLDSVLGFLGGAGLLVSVWWLYLKVRKREGLGLGDVKLLAMIGTMFGLECSWFTIFVGSMLGSIIGIGMAVASRRGFSNYIPFGPYLVAALMAFVLDFPGIYRVVTTGLIPVYWWVATQQ